MHQQLGDVVPLALEMDPVRHPPEVGEGHQDVQRVGQVLPSGRGRAHREVEGTGGDLIEHGRIEHRVDIGPRIGIEVPGAEESGDVDPFHPALEELIVRRSGGREARDGREGLTELGGGDRRGDPPARGPRHDLERKVMTRAVGVRPALGLLPLVHGLDEKIDHAGRISRPRLIPP